MSYLLKYWKSFRKIRQQKSIKITLIDTLTDLNLSLENHWSFIYIFVSNKQPCTKHLTNVQIWAKNLTNVNLRPNWSNKIMIFMVAPSRKREKFFCFNRKRTQMAQSFISIELAVRFVHDLLHQKSRNFWATLYIMQSKYITL